MAINPNNFIKAASMTNIYKFMIYMFPPEWEPIAARITETGVEFDSGMCKWAPRWSNIPWTVKSGKTELEASLKTCLYRIHDCFHQLWGLPSPNGDFSEKQYYLFKRVQMCGEVAVLTLSEFILCKYIYDNCPEVRPLLERRCSVPMMNGPLSNKTPLEIAMRLDDILHKKSKPKWVRDDVDSTKFYDYYVPMLEADRQGIDVNWKAMAAANWKPDNVPNSRYSHDLDGLELTIWMITDFYHLMKTDSDIDWGLTRFNRERRSKIVLPEGWQ